MRFYFLCCQVFCFALLEPWRQTVPSALIWYFFYIFLLFLSILFYSYFSCCSSNFLRLCSQYQVARHFLSSNCKIFFAMSKLSHLKSSDLIPESPVSHFPLVDSKGSAFSSLSYEYQFFSLVIFKILSLICKSYSAAITFLAHSKEGWVTKCSVQIVLLF